jgi:hypothetical protein
MRQKDARAPLTVRFAEPANTTAHGELVEALAHYPKCRFHERKNENA